MAKRSGNSGNKKRIGFAKKILTLFLAVLLVFLSEYNISLKDGGEDSWLEQIWENVEELFKDSTDTGSYSQENTDVDTKNTQKDYQTYGDSKLEVYFFDVEQADSILLMTEDKVMLVDTGNAGDATPQNKLVEGNINLTYELNRLGIDYIDILVATHAHEDHMGSMYKIINTFDIGDLYANATVEEVQEKGFYKRFIKAVESKNLHWIAPTTLSEEQLIAKVEEYNSQLDDSEVGELVYNKEDYIRVGDKIAFGDANITILAPNSAEYSDINDTSIVLLVEFEGIKMLLTGDAGEVSEKEILAYANTHNIDLNCDILKVGHHGSRTASTEAFIAAVDPEYSIIMVEAGHAYGLPDEDVIERLESQGSTIFQTTNEGDIKLTIDDGEFYFDVTYEHKEKQDEV